MGKTTRTLGIWAVLCMAPSQGCLGERGLVDETYRGEPVTTMQASLEVDPSVPLRGEPRMAIAWAADASTLSAALSSFARADVCGALRSGSVRLKPLEFEGKVSSHLALTFSSAPDASVQHTLDGSSSDGTTLAFGWVLTFDDVNRDHVFQASAGERLLGTSLHGGHAVLFVDGRISPAHAARWLLPQALPTGFSLLGPPSQAASAQLVLRPEGTKLAIGAAPSGCP